MRSSQHVEPAETTGLLDHHKQLTPSAISSKPQSFQWRAVTAFILALACCGCANSITLFSMFAPGFQKTLGYSPIQINTISIASSLGMYLPVPALGLIADRLGPGNLGLVSMAFFTPSYYIVALISRLSPEEAEPYFHLLCAAFVFIGTATSSLYFTGVLTCAKMLPKSPGLSISAPIACYGLSSLWQSQVIQRFFFDNHGDIILSQSFTFFSVLYFFVGIVAYIGSSVIGGVTGTKQPNSTVEEHTAVVPDDTNKNILISGEAADDSYGSVAESPEDAVYKRHETVSQFLQDRTVWIMFGAFVLISGPLEMYLNNMGMVLSTIPHHGPSVTTNVSLFSAFSTIARLCMGVLSDLLKDRVSRPTILVFILLFTALLNFLLASGVFTVIDNGRYFFLSSSGIGLSYGSVYTLVPTIVACTWGVENLGTHWGIFITAPALGSTGFSYLFATVYDAASSSISNLSSDVTTCTGRVCYELTFLATGTSLILSAILISLVWLFAWKPRRPLV